ncbi:MAG: hypothetical protein ACJAWV_003075 [Flammeovirgaceae bacterium]|jgi:hypothetical protein
MKNFNLDDIEKKQVFETPKDYFKDLPSIIQARAVETKSEPIWKIAFANPFVKFALPAFLIIMVFVWQGDFISTQPDQATTVETEALLAQLTVEEMQDYLLDEAEITHSDLVEITSDVSERISFEEQHLLDDEILEDIDLEDLESLM